MQRAITDTFAGHIDDKGTLIQLAGGQRQALGPLTLAWTGQPRFRDGSPDAFLAAIEDANWGTPESLLERIQGPFAMVLANSTTGDCLLAVDRLGLMPLAWYKEGKHILFASTLDGIIDQLPQRPDIDPQAVFDYVYFHMIPAPRTIYRGVNKLEPAGFLSVVGGRQRTGQYWRIPYREQAWKRAEAEERLGILIAEAVAKRIDARATGAFLSGGLDSTAVSGHFSRSAPPPHPVFTVGFEAKGYDETPWARAAAEHFGLDLAIRYVTPEDVIEAIPLIAGSYDEPFGNASAIPTYFCARHAREASVETLLAGDGGDELFAGNSRYLKQLLLARYDRLPAAIRHHLLTPLAEADSFLHRLPLVRKAVSYIRQASRPMPERMEDYNLLLRAGINQVFSPDFLIQVDTEDPVHLLSRAYRGDEPMSLLKHMLALDMKITIADNDIRKVSHMCRLAGIEVRYPMLDEALVEFSASLPTAWLIEGGELRAFYRRALADFLPRATLEKNKHGFGLPFGVWSTNHAGLARRVDDALRALGRRGWIREDYLQRLRRQHRGEHAAYYGVMIWVLMMLEEWLQEHGY